MTLNRLFVLILLASGKSINEEAMFAAIVRIQIKPEKRDAIIQYMLDDAVGSIENEPECLLFNAGGEFRGPQLPASVRSLQKRRCPRAS